MANLLAWVLDRVVQKSDETLICFGFAKSGGDAAKNRQLSLRRAKAIKAILDRDEKLWEELAKANFEIRDMQQFLSDLHKACGWEVEPGPVDNDAGPKTENAIKTFQMECNGRFGLGLKEDGKCGPKTWSAVLRAIHGQIQDALGEDSSKPPAWKKPKWGHGGKGVYANGQDFAQGASKAEEESVQITFFAPGSEPALKDAADAETPTVKHNPVQDEQAIAKTKAAPGTTKAPPQPKSELKFNGSKLTWINEKGEVAKTWKAVSGMPGYQTGNHQKEPNKGPIPAGIWIVKQSELQHYESEDWIDRLENMTGNGAWPGGEDRWGSHRVWLSPKEGTQTFGRGGFCIHGGKQPGSGGTIDLAGEMNSFNDFFLGTKKDLVLRVEYPPSNTTSGIPAGGGSASAGASSSNGAASGGELRTSEVGIELIKSYEGFKSHVYNCPAGHATIGYGTLLHQGGKTAADEAKYPNGVTKEQATELLKAALPEREAALRKAVKVPINQNQFDALMSWLYNFSSSRLVEADCTWLRELNKGHYDKVGDGLKMWNKADGVVMDGLVKRRQAEVDLFYKPVAGGSSSSQSTANQGAKPGPVPPTGSGAGPTGPTGAGGGKPGDYGPYDLKKGDNDDAKKWGGSVRSEAASYIKSLQTDLVKLGYWLTISDGRIGTNADGDFGGGTDSAVRTFQFEHFCVNADGTFASNWEQLANGVVDAKTKEKIKQQVTAAGSASWFRPGHIPKGTWTANGVKQTVQLDDGEKFYQLPPSNGYQRYFTNTASPKESTWTKKLSGVSTTLVAKCNEIVPGKNIPWIMSDCWGVKKLVNLLKQTGDQWAKKYPGQPFLIGDMSTFRGGALTPHAGHRDGSGVDISGRMASINAFTSLSDRDMAMELAKMLISNGAKRVLFNCNHLIKNVSGVRSMEGHGNHMHVDATDSRATTASGVCSGCGVKSKCTSKVG